MRAAGCLLLLPSLAAGSAAVDAKGTVLLMTRSQLGRTDPEVGEQDWEAFAGTGNVACRGHAAWDNNRSYYEVWSSSSEEACKALCLNNQPRCKGIEYSQGRCEIWTRKEGIASWVEPSFEGNNFTCQRYGWPAWHLQPMDGGVDKGCRGDHPNDKSKSYFNNYTVGNLEDCRALCVAADICRGLQFNMFRDGKQGRCEIWNRAIRATRNKTGQTCLRFEPPSVTATPTPSRTSPTPAPLSSTTTTSTATLTDLGAGDCRTATGLQPGYFEANHDNPRGACGDDDDDDANDDPDCVDSAFPLLFVSQEWCTRKCLEFSWCQGISWYAFGSGSTCWFYFQVGEHPEKPPDMIVADPRPRFGVERSYTFSWVDASNAGCGTSCTQAISGVDPAATKPWGGSFRCYVKRAPAGASPSTTAMLSLTGHSACEVFVERDSNFCTTCPECAGCDEFCATLATLP